MVMKAPKMSRGPRLNSLASSQCSGSLASSSQTKKASGGGKAPRGKRRGKAAGEPELTTTPKKNPVRPVKFHPGSRCTCASCGAVTAGLLADKPWAEYGEAPDGSCKPQNDACEECFDIFLNAFESEHGEFENWCIQMHTDKKLKLAFAEAVQNKRCQCCGCVHTFLQCSPNAHCIIERFLSPQRRR